MIKVKMFIRTQLIKLWCFLTGGTPVYVKRCWIYKNIHSSISYYNDTWVKVKIARCDFDPFDELNVLKIKDKRVVLELHSDGSVGVKSGRWMYVNNSKRTEMNLQQQ